MEALPACGVRMFARLRDSSESVREYACQVLIELAPEMLAPYADSDILVARLEHSNVRVRRWALHVLECMGAATIALHADAVVAMLEDNFDEVRARALETLCNLEPAALARHADALVAMLEDSCDEARRWALRSLHKLEPATLVQHAAAVISRLQRDSHPGVRREAERILRSLPLTITRGVDFDFPPLRSLRSQLLGRLGWYRCRLRVRAERLALYWYALPYRPSGQGHARDVEAWGRMIDTHGQRETPKGKKRPTEDGKAIVTRQRNASRTRSTKRKRQLPA